MGEVWEGHHELLGRRVAVKSLHRHLADDAVVLKRFIREGQAAARISHPNVVDILDVGVEQGVPILVMDFLDGPDLARVFAERGRLGVGELLGLTLPVIAAVAAAHDGGVVHRDLKPENVVVTRDRAGRPHPVVVDFGISRLLGHEESMRLTASGAIIGTPAYMSPEQARGDGDVGFPADQYALGAILFHGLTGQRPIEGSSLLEVLTRIVRGEHPRPIELVPTLDRRIDDIVMRAMAPRPDERFESVRALGLALLPFADEATRTGLAPEFARAASTVVGTTSGRGPARGTKRRRRRAWLAAGGVAAIGLGMGAMALTAPPTTPAGPGPAAPQPVTVVAAPEPGDADVVELATPPKGVEPLATTPAEPITRVAPEADASSPSGLEADAVPPANPEPRPPKTRPRASGPAAPATTAPPRESPPVVAPAPGVRTGTNGSPIID